MSQRTMAFMGLCLGFFIVMMDTTTVPLIYTSLITEFNISPATAAWVNNGYLITYAAFLLLGGRLGDTYNRRLIISSALVLISMGALISGFGNNLSEIIAGRAIMGIGAGLLTPQSMAYISILFAQEGRGKAFGIWGAVAGIATATGPVVTQMCLHLADWRWVMWINIPLAAFALVTTYMLLPNTKGLGLKVKELFFTGAFGLSISAVILGLQLIHSWDDYSVVVSLLLFLGGSAAIWLLWYELHSRTACILPFEIWKNKSYLRTCLISGVLGLSLTAFYLPLAYLIEIKMNFGPMAISVIMISIAIANALIGPMAGNLSDKIAPEGIVRYGLLSFSIAALMLGVVGIFFNGGTFAFITILVAMVFAGAGTGLAFAPLANLALRQATSESIGRAAAFFNASRQLMSAMGSVVIALMFDYVIRSSNENISPNNLEPYSPSVASAALVSFCFIALCLAVGAWLSRSYSVQGQQVNQN
ncbi:MFS transporter [Vibrio sp. Of7-15]|uniref:MFS transporter n=1 Tax=Vibrio sp. Of7-15 TaxID=2724879 RepID=UPI001EF3C68D|nr:MFS transporter [Vibrio sp. Of7-15]MCG7500096.1 MFS transporter [Vibrio sp. Of7-15]